MLSTALVALQSIYTDAELKLRQRVAAAATALQYEPTERSAALEFLLWVGNNDDVVLPLRLEALEHAAKYQQRRIAPPLPVHKSEHTGIGERLDKLNKRGRRLRLGKPPKR